MTLNLDYSQRLNLHALMGQQRGPVNDIRGYWKLQDKIELTGEEKTACGFRMVDIPGGGQQAVWNPAINEAKPFDLSKDEIDRLNKAIRGWESGFVVQERRWLEPLLAQLDMSENGHK
jgi:hypothetical protein